MKTQSKKNHNTGIIHFDASGQIGALLQGTKYGFSLSEATIPAVSGRETARIITLKSQSRITMPVLAAFPALKLVITRTAGTDHINGEACKRAGVQVRSIPDYGPSSIAEHVFALMLAAARNIVPAVQATRSGIFSYDPFLGVGLKGKTLGVIGTGRIGVEVLKIGKGFGMELVAYDVFRKEEVSRSVGFSYVPLSELLRVSDFVSVHVPLIPETKHLLGAREFAGMKEGSVLVNTARGAVIDTDALVAHISRFRGVALDVLEDESGFGAGHPLLAFPNVLITPHIAFYTDSSLKRIAGETNRLITEYESYGKGG